MGLQPLRPRFGSSFRPESEIVAAFEPRHPFRPHDRPNLFREKGPDVPRLGHSEVQPPNSEIDLILAKVHKPSTDGEVQGNVRMRRLKTAQPWNEPPHGN